MTPIWKLTARETVELLRTGAVTPLELVQIAQTRIAQTNPLLNATPIDCFDRARKIATNFVIPPNPVGPYFLYGLPILCKDEIDVQGVLCPEGSTLFANRVSAESATIVKLLEQNGGIVIGKTNQPEFASGSTTFNQVYGTTTNSWDSRLTAGGSSGGSAAALSCGQSWLALGTDLGGSLRIPASFCGVVGFRPSPARVPHDGVSPSAEEKSLHSTPGPMARNVRDLALLLDAIQGSQGWPFKLEQTYSFSSIVSQVNIDSNLLKRLAWSPNLGGPYPVDPEVLSICKTALNSFTAHIRATLQECCPDFSEAKEIFNDFRGLSYASNFAELPPESNPKYFGTQNLALMSKTKLLLKTIFKVVFSAFASLRLLELLKSVDSFFLENDFLFCPCVMVAPFDASLRYISETQGVQLESYVEWLFMTYALTLTCCPVISVPCGLTEDGLPVGIQILGRPQRDDQVLAIATLFEDFIAFDRQPIDPIQRANVVLKDRNIKGHKTLEEAKLFHNIKV